MTITITIPDAAAPAVIAGICRATNYDAGSGLTQAQWAKGKVITYIKDTAKRGQLMDSRDSINTTVEGVAIT